MNNNTNNIRLLLDSVTEEQQHKILAFCEKEQIKIQDFNKKRIVRSMNFKEEKRTFGELDKDEQYSYKLINNILEYCIEDNIFPRKKKPSIIIRKYVGWELYNATHCGKFFVALTNTKSSKDKTNPFFKIKIHPFKKEILNDEFMVSSIKKLSRFFKAIRISDKNIALANYVFIVLHELGHIDTRYRYRNCNELISKILDISNEIFKELFIDKNTKRYIISNIYQDRHSEVLADRFVYYNFPSVWNYLKEKGLIDNE